MAPHKRRLTIVMLIISLALPAWGQQYLIYTPQPVASGQKESTKDGILVKEIEIQKGDTLREISRKFSGIGAYFPQILLFNSIKNPNKIFAGETIRVPVSRINEVGSEQPGTKPAAASSPAKESKDHKPSVKADSHPADRKPATASAAPASNTEISLSDLKPASEKKQERKHRKKKSASHAKKILSDDTSDISLSSTPQKISTGKHVASASTATTSGSGQKLFEAAAKAYRKDDCRSALELLDRFLADHPSSPLSADANLYKADCYLRLSAQ